MWFTITKWLNFSTKNAYNLTKLRKSTWVRIFRNGSTKTHQKEETQWHILCCTVDKWLLWTSVLSVSHQPISSSSCGGPTLLYLDIDKDESTGHLYRPTHFQNKPNNFFWNMISLNTFPYKLSHKKIYKNMAVSILPVPVMHIHTIQDRSTGGKIDLYTAKILFSTSSKTWKTQPSYSNQFTVWYQKPLIKQVRHICKDHTMQVHN